jgi:hypothetical protein
VRQNKLDMSIPKQIRNLKIPKQIRHVNS